MKTVPLGTTGLKVPSIALGSSRLKNLTDSEADTLFGTAIDQGINFFDTADGYGDGRCEEILGSSLKSLHIERDKYFIQTKCGNVHGIKHDFSKDYILKTVDRSLKRLGVEYVDVLLLHRPDALVEPEEVAEAFDMLKKYGKVHYFGVSNHKAMQIELLRRYIIWPLAVNQLQLSITNAQLIANGMNVNTFLDEAVERDGSVLDYCRINDITVQTWSPFQYGKIEGVFLGNEKFSELNMTIKDLSEKYNVSDTAIALAWILRHPAKMQAIVGTTHPDRLLRCAEAVSIDLTREDWYKLYLSAGHTLGH
jgi:predicted oxidoreductase